MEKIVKWLDIHPHRALEGNTSKKDGRTIFKEIIVEYFQKF